MTGAPGLVGRGKVLIVGIFEDIRCLLLVKVFRIA